MTLVIGMYYNNRKGALIASDSRVVEDHDIFPKTQKIFKINNFVFGFAGTLYLRDEIIEELKKIEDESPREKIQEAYIEKIEKYTLGDNPLLRKSEFSCETLFNFYTQDCPHLVHVDDKGILEPLYRGFAAIGQPDYTNVVLREIYQDKITKQQAINTAIYCINETAKINGGVDDHVQIALIEKNESRILNLDKRGKFNFEKPEFEEIKKRLTGVSSLQSNVLNILINGKEEDKNKLERLLNEINS